jgi:hypothetical protein
MRRSTIFAVLWLAACAQPETPLELCAPLPAVLHLGTVAVGATNRVVVLATGLPGAVATVTPGDFTVSTSDGLAIEVSPTAPGRRTATLSVEDPACGARAAELTVDAVTSCVDLPASVTFPAVEHTCGRAPASLLITNHCDAPVTLAASVVEPPDADGAWCHGRAVCVDFHVAESQRVVGANSVASWSLVATPAAVGEVTGTLRLTVGQGDGRAVHQVALTAQGLARPRVTERFPAPAKEVVDILLVVDTSAASVPHQASARYNLGILGTYIKQSALGMHTRLHVAAAEMTPGPVAHLDSEVDDVEVGLRRALDSLPVAKAPSCAQGLLNLAAFASPTNLTVGLCVMYSPDATTGPWTVLTAQLQTLLARVSIVGPFETPFPGCTEQLDDGRYRYLTDWTGGVAETVCTPDWATALLWERVEFGWGTRFYLTRRSLRGPELVVIGDVVLPKVDRRGGVIWQWEPEFNAINFEPFYTMAPEGPPLEVTYELPCDEVP